MIFIQTLVHTPNGSLTFTGKYDVEMAEKKIIEIAEYYKFIYGKVIVYQYVMDCLGDTLEIVKFD